jgi:hypothetical protein
MPYLGAWADFNVVVYITTFMNKIGCLTLHFFLLILCRSSKTDDSRLSIPPGRHS